MPYTLNPEQHHLAMRYITQVASLREFFQALGGGEDEDEDETYAQGEM